MKKLVITFVAVIAVSLSGCSSMSDPNSKDVTNEETETSQPEILSGNCETIQTEVSNVIPYLSGFAGEYSQSERYSAVSETAEKLDGILGTHDFTPGEKTLLRGMADGLYKIKAFYDGEATDLFNAIDSVESGLSSVNSLCGG